MNNQTEQDLLDILTREGYEHVEEKNGRLCGLVRFIFTVGVCIDLDCTGYSGRFCFDTYANAKLFFDEWDGKPETTPTVGLDGCTAIK